MEGPHGLSGMVLIGVDAVDVDEIFTSPVGNIDGEDGHVVITKITFQFPISTTIRIQP